MPTPPSTPILVTALAALAACGQSDAPAAPSEAGEASTAQALVQENVAPAEFNLLLVTIDTLRADHLGCYGYFRDTSPTLDALAAESIVFDRCIVPIATTLPSHTSMMTGTAPHEHGVLSNIEGQMIFERAPHLATLAEFLSTAGKSTGAVISAFPLHPHFGLDAGFDKYWFPTERAQGAEDTSDLALKWLARERSAPFFLWLHYFDPHTPYSAPAEYTAMFQDEPALEQWTSARAVAPVTQHRRGKQARANVIHNGYDAEVRYTDAQLARVFEHLRSTGEWERTVVVLLADHGEGLNQHERPGHGWIWDEQLHVPFMIRVPGVAALRTDTLVTAADLVPILFHLFDWPAEDAFLEQVSGSDALAPRAAPAVLSQSSPAETGASEALTYSLTTAGHKYIRAPDGTEALYALSGDPHELTDVAAQQPEQLAEHRARLESVLTRQLRTATRTRPATSLEAEALQALGYGGDDDPDENDPDGNGADASDGDE